MRPLRGEEVDAVVPSRWVAGVSSFVVRLHAATATPKPKALLAGRSCRRRSCGDLCAPRPTQLRRSMRPCEPVAADRGAGGRDDVPDDGVRRRGQPCDPRDGGDRALVPRGDDRHRRPHRRHDAAHGPLREAALRRGAGMGINAFFTFGIVLGQKVPCPPRSASCSGPA